MAPVIGIDLGTVCSCVGVYQHGDVEIVANAQGDRVTPSVVAFTNNERLIGNAAKVQADQNFENTVYDAKRMIGRKYEDIQAYDLTRWPFKIVEQGELPKFEISTVEGISSLYAPEQISAAVLTEMKTIAEEYLGDCVKDAVITVPAHFNNAQRQATKDAAEIAGLNILQLLNEPTAAAVAYGLKQKLQKNQNILVFDMGGGTFDVSILTIDQNDVYQVRAVGGDTHLGGEDFNNKMLDHFAAELTQKRGLDVKADKRAMGRLLRECEKAKITLSTDMVAEVRVIGLMQGFDFVSSITRATFERLNGEFFAKALAIVEETIVDAKLEKSDIHEVVLVGGSTYIPKVQQMLQNCFNGKELNKTIKPDEAVAYGAAIYASVLGGDDADEFEVVLVDVTPHSLGIELIGQRMSTIIDRNSTIPINLTEKYTTTYDDQTKVRINIYEGENPTVTENDLLGTFLLEGIPPEPAGVPKLQVSMDIDTDGILKVHAVCLTNGVEEEITIQEYSTRLDPNEIQEHKETESGIAMLRKE